MRPSPACGARMRKVSRAVPALSPAATPRNESGPLDSTRRAPSLTDAAPARFFQPPGRSSAAAAFFFGAALAFFAAGAAFARSPL